MLGCFWLGMYLSGTPRVFLLLFAHKWCNSLSGSGSSVDSLPRSSSSAFRGSSGGQLAVIHRVADYWVPTHIIRWFSCLPDSRRMSTAGKQELYCAGNSMYEVVLRMDVQ